MSDDRAAAGSSTGSWTPPTQYYFDRLLCLLLSAFFEQGLVLDGLEEPVFESRPDDRVSVGRGPFVELPPVLVARLRVAG